MEGERLYHSMCHGYPVQTRLSKELHKDAGVPEGPCGLAELDQF